MNEIDMILALSAVHETETSPLTREKLVWMLDEAFYSKAANVGRDGYLISFDQDAAYDSINFFGSKRAILVLFISIAWLWRPMRVVKA